MQRCGRSGAPVSKKYANFKELEEVPSCQHLPLPGDCLAAQECMLLVERARMLLVCDAETESRWCCECSLCANNSQ